MTGEEAAKILSLHLMQCGMLMPIEWVQNNGEGSRLHEAMRMALDALCPDVKLGENGLAPCPFCGGEAHYSAYYGAVTVVCSKCGAKSKSVGDRKNGPTDKHGAVRDAWNKRALGGNG